MNEYRVITYDVWGNEEDGYTVNDAFHTGRTIELDDDASDEDIVAALVEADELYSSAKADDLLIEGEMEYTLYVSNMDTMYPYLELQRKE